jgi:outer membrane immunogenic protein
VRKMLLVAAATLAVQTAPLSAADLGAPRTPVAAAVAAPVFNWTGFYLGGHLGYGTGRSTWGALGVADSFSPSGVFAGLQAGYNWQINQMVVGVEADVAYAGLRSSRVCANLNPGFTCDTRADMLASLRLRGGFAVDRTLIYVTGGLGLGSLKHRDSFTNTGVTWGTFNVTRAGFVVGAGMEYAFTPNVTAKLEYLYYDFGTASQGGDPGTIAGNGNTIFFRTNVHTVKLGLNYLFTTGPSPVSARY